MCLSDYGCVCLSGTVWGWLSLCVCESDCVTECVAVGLSLCVWVVESVCDSQCVTKYVYVSLWVRLFETLHVGV